MISMCMCIMHVLLHQWLGGLEFARLLLPAKLTTEMASYHGGLAIAAARLLNTIRYL